MRSLAWRNREEATNSIALVICMVDSTVFMRWRRAFMEPGIRFTYPAGNCA